MESSDPVRIGFSTGAIAFGDFRSALRLLEKLPIDSVELSSLRVEELEPLLAAIPTLNLSGFVAKSVHGPSKFAPDQESRIAELLYFRVPLSWHIVIHPDAICDYSLWKPFGSRVAIENMDRRKPIGRSVRELGKVFDKLPDASFCFDIGHAKQFDPSMSEAYFLLVEYGSRLAQVHVSEVNSASQHAKVSYGGRLAFEDVRSLIPASVPLIIESKVTVTEIQKEILKVAEIFSRNVQWATPTST